MNLHIPKPCKENWDAMHSAEKGRFCDVCQKQVFDFTNATIDEIKYYYDKNNGSLCGRISGKLLREQFLETQYKNDYFKKLKQFLFAAIVCFGINLFTIEKAAASVFNTMKTQFLATQPDTLEYITIKGEVKDKETKEVLPFANVLFKDGDSVIAGTSTDIDGKYTLKIKKQQYKKASLTVVYIGYISYKVDDIKIENTEININIHAMTPMFLGEMIIEIPPEPSIKPNPFQSGKTITSDEYQRMPK
jgi:hypothetical protein